MYANIVAPLYGGKESTMNQADILASKLKLQEEKDQLIAAAMTRFDEDMKGESVAERQKRLIYGLIYTAEEVSQLAGLDKRINGYTHMLDQGFFREKPAPRKDKEEEEPLY